MNRCLFIWSIWTNQFTRKNWTIPQSSEDHSKEPVELDFPTLHLREERSNKPMGLIYRTISKNTNKRQKLSNKSFQKHYSKLSKHMIERNA